MIVRLVEENLNEAFSPTMPQALKAWLSGEANKYKTKQLLNLGIDPASSTFEEVPVPTTNRDPFFKETDKIKVYDFGPDGIYFQGINDDLNFVRPDGKMQPAKYLPAKAIMEMAKHIYLVDPTETAQELAGKRSNRRDMELERKKDPNRKLTPDELKYAKAWDPAKKNSYSYFGKVADKSGYLIDPKQLEKRLAKSGLFKPDKKLQRAYDSIVKLRNDISSVLMDMNDSGNRIKMDRNMHTAAYNAMSNLSTAAQYYNNLLSIANEYDEYKAGGNLNPDYVSSVKSRFDSALKTVETYTDCANGYIGSYIGTLVDWDTDEDDI